MKIRITLSYLGGDFCGWQVQPQKRTVQGALGDAFEKLFGCPVDITGASRTDSGVHARGFSATVSPRCGEAFANSIPCEAIPRAVNTLLPHDVAVISAEEVPDSFHARYDVRSKEYEYLIRDGGLRSPFYDGRAWQYPRRLDADAMAQACPHFLGTHDFAAFMASGSSVESTVRTIYSLTVERCDDYLRIRVSADGFLYNMVRIIAGTLVEVGEGKRSPDDIPDMIASGRRERAGRTAPPEGLYLNHVMY